MAAGKRAKFWNIYLLFYSSYNLRLWATVLYLLGL